MPFDLPEPNQRLGLKERAGDPTRQFKHLHQMCLRHAESLAISCEFKLLGLLDGYLACTQEGSTIGCYLFARTVLEQCAFLIEVNRRLTEIAAKPNSSWMPKGEEFFSLLVRFRFATGDKALQKNLEEIGFPPKLLKPVNVMSCVAALSTRPEVAHLGGIYDTLCDYVHHNGPSHFTASSGFFIGTIGMHHQSGGAIVMKRPGPISRFEYPNPAKLKMALEHTAANIALASKTCAEMLKKLPRTPYSAAFILKMTGTESGLGHLGQSERTRGL